MSFSTDIKIQLSGKPDGRKAKNVFLSKTKEKKVLGEESQPNFDLDPYLVPQHFPRENVVRGNLWRPCPVSRSLETLCQRRFSHVAGDRARVQGQVPCSSHDAGVRYPCWRRLSALGCKWEKVRIGTMIYHTVLAFKSVILLLL